MKTLFPHTSTIGIVFRIPTVHATFLSFNCFITTCTYNSSHIEKFVFFFWILLLLTLTTYNLNAILSRLHLRPQENTIEY